MQLSDSPTTGMSTSERAWRKAGSKKQPSAKAS
jgi:hypothetical protein